MICWTIWIRRCGAHMPDFLLEQAAQANGCSQIAGVDEVGRGPLCGPVTAAAVILNSDDIPDGLNDSKKLLAKKRAALYDEILARAQVGIGHATVAEIDDINILQASHLAMIRAIDNLPIQPDYVLIDGNRAPKALQISHETVVKGDAKSASIAAASIVAKITRDAIMAALDAEFPGYDWAKNAGYPTADHLEALKRLGVTPHHRRSFKPVHNMLYQEK